MAVDSDWDLVWQLHNHEEAIWEIEFSVQELKNIALSISIACHFSEVQIVVAYLERSSILTVFS